MRYEHVRYTCDADDCYAEATHEDMIKSGRWLLIRPVVVEGSEMVGFSILRLDECAPPDPEREEKFPDRHACCCGCMSKIVHRLARVLW